MNPEKKLYSLADVNFFLAFLGLFPLQRTPTSRIIIHFWNKNVSIAVQPVYIWKTTMLAIPNYEKMRYDFENSIFPVTLMHFDLEFHFGLDKKDDENLYKKMFKINKALDKRGKYLEI